jgi:glycine oxidase
MKIFETAIIGNGIIGTMIAYQLSKKKSNAILIGPKNRKGSASAAAGAMLNVFGEIDYDIENNEYLKRKVNLGVLATKKWNKLKKDKIFKDVFTADDTVIFQSNNATKLEKLCFNSIRKYAEKYKILVNQDKKLTFLKNSKSFKSKKFFMLKGEGAIDIKKLFKNLDNYLKDNKNIICLEDYASDILKTKNKIKIKTTNNKTIYANKVVICNGSFLKKINFKNKKNVLDVYYGIGNAVEIYDKNDILKKQLPTRTVLRSPNRGSTCGIHIVPRKNSEYYLGAGSEISHKENYKSKIGTTLYLLNAAKNEIISNISKLDFIPVLGFRPFSFDGQPIFGKFNKDISIVSGTKRDGLTLAPLIVEEILKEIQIKDYTSKLFNGWSPLRKPISFRNQLFSSKVYIDNKISGLLEHKDITKKDVPRVKKELMSESVFFHKKIIKLKNLDKKFAIHPELLNTFR